MERIPPAGRDLESREPRFEETTEPDLEFDEEPDLELDEESDLKSGRRPDEDLDEETDEELDEEPDEKNVESTTKKRPVRKTGGIVRTIKPGESGEEPMIIVHPSLDDDLFNVLKSWGDDGGDVTIILDGK